MFAGRWFNSWMLGSRWFAAPGGEGGGPTYLPQAMRMARFLKRQKARVYRGRRR